MLQSRSNASCAPCMERPPPPFAPVLMQAQLAAGVPAHWGLRIQRALREGMLLTSLHAAAPTAESRLQPGPGKVEVRFLDDHTVMPELDQVWIDEEWWQEQFGADCPVSWQQFVESGVHVFSKSGGTMIGLLNPAVSHGRTIDIAPYSGLHVVLAAHGKQEDGYMGSVPSLCPKPEAASICMNVHQGSQVTLSHLLTLLT